MFEQATFVNGTADGVMPAEENNFLIAVKLLLKDPYRPVATKTILHTLGLFTNSFSTMSNDFELQHDSLIQITEIINKKKIKNSPLYSKIVVSLWPILTSKVKLSSFFQNNIFRVVSK
jgi:hypothetical protein